MKKSAKKITKKTKRVSPARKHIPQDLPPVVQGLTAAELENPHLFFWKTRDGRILRISDMQLDHLLNARALLRRRIAKQSEVEEVMSNEVRRRTGSLLAKYGAALDACDPMGKYSEAWEDNDPFDSHGQH